MTVYGNLPPDQCINAEDVARTVCRSTDFLTEMSPGQLRRTLLLEMLALQKSTVVQTLIHDRISGTSRPQRDGLHPRWLCARAAFAALEERRSQRGQSSLSSESQKEKSVAM